MRLLTATEWLERLIRFWKHTYPEKRKDVMILTQNTPKEYRFMIRALIAMSKD